MAELHEKYGPFHSPANPPNVTADPEAKTGIRYVLMAGEAPFVLLVIPR